MPGSGVRHRWMGEVVLILEMQKLKVAEGNTLQEGRVLEISDS